MWSSSKHRSPFSLDIPIPTGGLNVSLPAASIGQDQVSDERNMWLSPTGGYETRPGLAKLTVTALPAAVTGIHYSAVLDEYLASCDDGNLYSFDLSGATVLIGALTGSLKQVDFADFKGACYVASGGTLQVYDGTSLDLVVSGTSNPAPVAAQYVEAFGSRIWVAETDSRLDYCGTEVPTDWGGAIENSGGYVYIQDGDGATISGLGLVEGVPLVFKSKGGEGPFTVAKIEGSSVDDYCPMVLSKGLACLNGHTIAPMQNDLLFAGVDGVFSLAQLAQFENPRPFPLSLKIHPLLKTYSPLAGLYVPKWGCYLLLTSLYTMVYHAGTQSWHQWVHESITPTVLALDESGNVLVGGSDGHIYRFQEGVFTDAGDSFVSSFTSGVISGQTPQLEKLWQWLHVAYSPLGTGSFSVSWRKDWGKDLVRAAASAAGEESLIGWDGEFGWDAEGVGYDQTSFEIERRRLSYRGRDIQVQISSSAPFRFQSLGVSGALLRQAPDAWK